MVEQTNGMVATTIVCSALMNRSPSLNNDWNCNNTPKKQYNNATPNVIINGKLYSWLW